jgi:hypothetical protein
MREIRHDFQFLLCSYGEEYKVTKTRRVRVTIIRSKSDALSAFDREIIVKNKHIEAKVSHGSRFNHVKLIFLSLTFIVLLWTRQQLY